MYESDDKKQEDQKNDDWTYWMRDIVVLAAGMQTAMASRKRLFGWRKSKVRLDGYCI
jgi:hypothetical protein